jgi:hypothetical protein
MNILLALRQRDITNEACHIDVAKTSEELIYFYVLGNTQTETFLVSRSTDSDDLVTGGSPRYQIYRTSRWKIYSGCTH